MPVLSVPPFTEAELRKPWPTLGPQVAAVMEQTLIFGPGDLRGEPARLSAEFRAQLYRMYEVYPKDHPQAGRRRFKRCGLSMRKGTAKTEKAAWIAAMELFAEAPVRTDGWRKVGKDWEPVGAPVRDPYIPMLATTEEQGEELAFGALYVIIGEGPLADYFDVGLKRIMRLDGAGKAEAVANSPRASDGARTTFEHFDETHHFTTERLRTAHLTMLQNLPKRVAADAWALETTTSFAPGAGSVAEDTYEYAKQVERGQIKDSSLFYFHREASDKWDLTDPDQTLKAVTEASGPDAEWSDLRTIASQFSDPTLDQSWLMRVWLNRRVRAGQQAFDYEAWKAIANPGYKPERQTLITLGLDGGRSLDATALIACEVETGFMWPIAIWQKTVDDPDDWEVPEEEVNAAVAEAMSDYNVWRMYVDPPHWEAELAHWAAEYGKERVLAWHTWRHRPMAYAVGAFANAILNKSISHDGSPMLSDHIGNSHRRYLGERDEKGQPLWVVVKVRPDSPDKVDAAVAAILANLARNDAITAGAVADDGPSVYETRGIITVGPRVSPESAGLVLA